MRALFQQPAPIRQTPLLCAPPPPVMSPHTVFLDRTVTLQRCLISVRPHARLVCGPRSQALGVTLAVRHCASARRRDTKTVLCNTCFTHSTTSDCKRFSELNTLSFFVAFRLFAPHTLSLSHSTSATLLSFSFKFLSFLSYTHVTLSISNFIPGGRHPGT